MERRLMYHAESDCYYECFDEATYEADCNYGVDDATGVPHHEAEFSNREALKLKGIDV